MKDTDTILQEQAIQQHVEQLKKNFYQIDVQILKVGDTYTTVTGEGEETITVDADGMLPAKKNFTDAGFDLYTPYDIELLPGQVKKVPLNIRMELPAGSWGRIETKSGLGAKGMLVYAGVIDQGYRGIPHVIMTNLSSDNAIRISAGSKCAQMTMNPHSLEFYINEVEQVDTATARGEGGFGSTGAK